MKSRLWHVLSTYFLLSTGIIPVVSGETNTDSQSLQGINTKPQNCGVELAVPDWICVNDNDDDKDEKWDFDIEPESGEKDTAKITVTGTADKSDATVTIEVAAGSDKIDNFWKGTRTEGSNVTGTELDGKEKRSGKTSSFTVPAGKTVVQTLYLEGIKHSDVTKDVKIKAKITAPEITIGNIKYEKCDKETPLKEITVYQVDLDVDSKNDNAFDFAGFDKAEDEIEASEKTPKKAGKYIFVNAGFSANDNEAAPGWADGFEVGGATSVARDAKFTPIQIELKEPFDISKAKIKFVYSTADPKSVTRAAGGGTPTDQFTYTLGAGSKQLRIWKENFTTTRDKKDAEAGGHYIPDKEIDWSKVSSSRTAKLYIESVRPSAALGDINIEIVVTQEGVSCKDRVDVTSVYFGNEKLDLTVNAAATYHVINNTLTVAGNGKALEYAVTADFVPSNVDCSKVPLQDTRMGLVQNVTRDKRELVWGNPDFHTDTQPPAPNLPNVVWFVQNPVVTVSEISAGLNAGDRIEIASEIGGNVDLMTAANVVRVLDGNPSLPALWPLFSHAAAPLATNLPKPRSCGGIDVVEYDTPTSPADPTIPKTVRSQNGQSINVNRNAIPVNTTTGQAVGPAQVISLPVKVTYNFKKVKIDTDFICWCTSIDASTKSFNQMKERAWQVKIDTSLNNQPQPVVLGNGPNNPSMVSVRGDVANNILGPAFTSWLTTNSAAGFPAIPGSTPIVITP